MIQNLKEHVMKPELGLCTIEPFMQAFNKLENAEGSYFGPEYPDFESMITFSVLIKFFLIKGINGNNTEVG